MNKNEQLMYKSIADMAKAIEKLVKLLEKNMKKWIKKNGYGWMIASYANSVIELWQKKNTIFVISVQIVEMNTQMAFNMRRLIYDMYYADEISVEIAERLLDRLEKSQEKRRKNGRY